MKKLVLFFTMIFMPNEWVFSDPIETPEFDQQNKFAIHTPPEWGYRTLKGENGLIGVLWPTDDMTFNKAQTVIFVFLQNAEIKDENSVANINLFTEKCPLANFHLSSEDDMNDPTKSLNEKYFSGRCGRTTVLVERVVQNYRIIIRLSSGRYVLKKELEDAKEVAASYIKEIEKYIKDNDKANNSAGEKNQKTRER